MGIVVFIIFISYLTCIVLFIYGWDAIKAPLKSPDDYPSITIIIAARNEEANIENCLRSIVHQHYPANKLQILCVDDYSSDSTLQKIRSFDGVQALQLKDFISEDGLRSGKKKCIEYAMRFATGEYVLITDADCIAPVKWVRSVAICFESFRADVVTGAISIYQPNTFFKQLQALDIWSYISLSASAIGLSKPVLANGANFAFKKIWFDKVNGYAGSEHISSGDDVFLLHKFLKYGAHTVFNKSKDALIETMPTENLLSFIIQRIRWASKTAGYRNLATVLIILIIMLSYLTIPMLLIVAAIQPIVIKWLVGFLLMKCFIDFIYLYRVLNFFGKRSLLNLFLPAQLFHISYVLMVGAVALFIPLKWKGRKLYR